MDEGRIAFISVGWLGPDDDMPVVVSLGEMRKHCRPERVDELVGDLVMLCSDVEKRRGATPGLHAVE